MSPLTNAPWKSRFSVVVGYRLGLYDPCRPNDDPELIGPLFTGSPADRQAMTDIIHRYNELAAQRKTNAYCLSVFPVEAA